MAQYPQPPSSYPSSSVAPWGGILATTGAVVLAGALFLPWASISLDFLGDSFSASVNGLNEWPGLLAALVALGSLVLGILAMTLRTRSGRKGMAIALVATGGLGLAATVIALVMNLEVLGYGVYVAFAGALLIVGGGLLAFGEASRLAERRGYVAGYSPQPYQQPPPGYPQQTWPPGGQPPPG